MPHPNPGARTPFGRYVATLRAERDERLRDMADVLLMSPAYLSSIEVGRRNVPDGLLEKLITTGYVAESERAHLEALIHLSRTTQRFHVKDLSLEHQRLVRLFALRLPSMTEQELADVRALLEPEVRT